MNALTLSEAQKQALRFLLPPPDERDRRKRILRVTLESLARRGLARLVGCCWLLTEQGRTIVDVRYRVLRKVVLDASTRPESYSFIYEMNERGIARKLRDDGFLTLSGGEIFKPLKASLTATSRAEYERITQELAQ